MKIKIQNFLFASLLITFFPFLVLAQTNDKQPSVRISGEVLTPIDVSGLSLQEFQQTSINRKDKDGKMHRYDGIALAQLLKRAGVTLNNELRGENLTKYLLVEASDGYQVVFSLAELDESFTDRKIILSNKMDGKPLPVADGPFRLIVEDEKVPARCIKQVTSIQIKFSN